MDTNLGLNSYKLWLAIRQHFTTEKYDFIKYNGGVKNGREQYMKRPDKGFFYRLAKKYPKQLRDFYISIYCRAGNEKAWIGSFYNDSKYHTEFVAWQRRYQARTKTLHDDVLTIAEVIETLKVPFKGMLHSKNGKLPLIVQLENQDHISPETVVMVNALTNFTSLECLHPSWPETTIRLTKYQRFVSMNGLKEFASTLKDAISH